MKILKQIGVVLSWLLFVVGLLASLLQFLATWLWYRQDNLNDQVITVITLMVILIGAPFWLWLRLFGGDD